MHTVTVEISKPLEQVVRGRWRRVDSLRRIQPVHPYDKQETESFHALYLIMEDLAATEPATTCRTANREGVVYEFPSMDPGEVCRIMTRAGFSDWDEKDVPDVPVVALRIGMA